MNVRLATASGALPLPCGLLKASGRVGSLSSQGGRHVHDLDTSTRGASPLQETAVEPLAAEQGNEVWSWGVDFVSRQIRHLGKSGAVSGGQLASGGADDHATRHGPRQKECQ